MTVPAAGVFPYAPAVIRDYLITVLPQLPPNDVRVATKVPAVRPDNLVTITTAPAGGGTNIALQPRRLIIHCYHADEKTAGELAELVLAHLRTAVYGNGNRIRAITVVGTPALFPDPDDATPRVQMTVDVLLRATY